MPGADRVSTVAMTLAVKGAMRLIAPVFNQREARVYLTRLTTATSMKYRLAVFSRLSQIAQPMRSSRRLQR